MDRTSSLPGLLGVLAWTGALLTAGCPADLTEIVVVVDTDLEVPAEVDELALSVTGPTKTMFERAMALDGSTQWPVTLGLLQEGGQPGPVVVAAEARAGGTVRVRQTARSSFAAGSIRTLALHLPRRCLERSCPGEQTCGPDGRCVSPERSDLPVWGGEPEPRLGDFVPAPPPEPTGARWFVSPSGDDANPGTRAEPFASIGRALGEAAAGETVVLLEGTHAPVDPIVAVGRAEAPIGVEAAADARPVVPRLVFADGARHVRVRGLVIDGELGGEEPLVLLEEGTSAIDIGWSEVRNGHADGVFASGSDHRIVGNHIHNNGTSEGAEGIQATGQRVLVANNVVHDNTGNGILLHPSMDGAIVAGNTVAANGRSGIHISEAVRTTVVNNITVAHPHEARGGGYGIRAVLDADETAANIARNNLVFGNLHPFDGALFAGFRVTSDNFSSDPQLRATGPAPEDPAECCADGPPAPVERDLRPDSSSPARARGLVRWGVTPDAAGTGRPQGEGLDVGAFEAP